MIHYITVATEEKLYLKYLKQLLPELVILGMNNKWEGFITKYKLVIEYLNKLNENDIICFIDAYDVLPTKNIGKLKDKFIEFIKNNPEIKMIVGYEVYDINFIENYAKSFMGAVNEKGDRLNTGTYIGYVKNIKQILSSILINNPNMEDDQIELTKYANQFPNEIYTDINKFFFNVITKPLGNIQIEDENYEYCFIHANANGNLNLFLYKHHNIDINFIDNINILIDNYKAILKKLYIYL